MDDQRPSWPFYSVEEETKQAPNDKLAFLDQEFMLREALRPVRLQVEYLKPEIMQRDQHIESTVVVFGSARILPPDVAKEKLAQLEAKLAKKPDDDELIKQIKQAKMQVEQSFYYEESRRFARMISETFQKNTHRNFVVVTGGGPGIMEAANRGAHDVNAKSIGLNISLPHEQGSNPYVTPELSFQFHYFGMRKMHFLMRAAAAVYFPGGFGTFDELFETLTLIQTQKIDPFPILLFGRKYWDKVVNFDVMIEQGYIDKADILYFRYVETAEEAWDVLINFYKIHLRS